MAKNKAYAFESNSEETLEELDDIFFGDSQTLISSLRDNPAYSIPTALRFPESSNTDLVDVMTRYEAEALQQGLNILRRPYR